MSVRVLPLLCLAVAVGACGTKPTAADPVDASPTPDASDVPRDSAVPDASAPPVELVDGCTATAALAGHTLWIHFTHPAAPCLPTETDEAGVDANILTELIRLIDSVPAGGRIDGHIFNITVDSVGAALLRAQERGVDVWLSTDKRVGTSTDSVRTMYLDNLTHVVYCGTSDTGSCVGATSNSISHTKLFVFSTAIAPDGSVHDDVSWFGSANQTRASGMKSFNNTVTVYGDTALYDQFRTYLDDLYAQRRRTDYYDAASGRGYMLADAADVYASPETDTDLVINRLNDITPDDDCRVRVMQASVRDSRIDVVNLLIRMKQGGCRVWVAANTVEPDALAALKGAGIPIRQNKVHDKVFVVRGRYGDELRHRVYTGSHNLSISANRKYDEIFVKLAPEVGSEHPVYDAYYTHFNDAYNAGDPL